MLALTMVLVMLAAEPSPTLMTPIELQALPLKAGDIRQAYRPGPNQFGELYLPRGPGPHPVVVLIHGACFRADLSTLDDLAPMASALKVNGVAAWNVEYRRPGQAGGGWPGTYQDIGHAIDHLRDIAPRYNLDLTRVVVVGHATGGRLALWSASRATLPQTSPVAAPDPLEPRGVMALASLPDLRETSDGYDARCGPPRQTLAVGARDAAGNAADVAAVERIPGVDQVVVVGDRPAKATAVGDNARLMVIPGADRFDIATLSSPAWPHVRTAILTLLNGGAEPRTP